MHIPEASTIDWVCRSKHIKRQTRCHTATLAHQASYNCELESYIKLQHVTTYQKWMKPLYIFQSSQWNVWCKYIPLRTYHQIRFKSRVIFILQVFKDAHIRYHILPWVINYDFEIEIKLLPVWSKFNASTNKILDEMTEWPNARIQEYIASRSVAPSHQKSNKKFPKLPSLVNKFSPFRFFSTPARTFAQHPRAAWYFCTECRVSFAWVMPLISKNDSVVLLHVHRCT